MKLFNGMTVENNELAISGVTVSELRRKYGTPLYVYDEILDKVSSISEQI